MQFRCCGSIGLEILPFKTEISQKFAIERDSAALKHISHVQTVHTRPSFNAKERSRKSNRATKRAESTVKLSNVKSKKRADVVTNVKIYSPVWAPIYAKTRKQQPKKSRVTYFFFIQVWLFSAPTYFPFARRDAQTTRSIDARCNCHVTVRTGCSECQCRRWDRWKTKLVLAHDSAWARLRRVCQV